VGFTLRHHTFFEMLGNFSFGDYFKEEAIEFAWKFITDILNIDKTRLFITVFKDDDESFKLWQDNGVATNKIYRLDEKTNFWEMGEIGPCGYSTEIYFDRGEWGKNGELVLGVFHADSDIYIELWNIVFMEYTKDAIGKMTELKNKNVDTGMGLERLCAVMQNKISNFDTDIFTPIKRELIDELKIKTKEIGDKNFILNIISDHIRALTFAIGDNIIPSNTERGYVLRRILRRASRYAFEFKRKEPLLYKFVPVVIRLMKDDYPELEKMQDFIMKTIFIEEENFLSVVDSGLKVLYNKIDAIKGKGKDEIEPEFVFKLYDTYGFPVDITMDTLKKEKLNFKIEEFNGLIESQRNISRSKIGQTIDSEYINIIQDADVHKTIFNGYDNLELQTEIKLIIKDKRIVNKIHKNDEVIIICSETPFYAESGGQIGDRGIIFVNENKIEVHNTQRQGDFILHFGKVKMGRFETGDEVIMQVDAKFRKDISRNHTCTHILHYALRKVLGEFVRQSGSYVADTKFRFDFNYVQSLTTEQLVAIQEEVQEVVLNDVAVEKFITNYNDALHKGAIALFDEKYSEQVRVVKIGDYSIELCAGTHLESTGEIGLFNIISESSIGSSLRRIEADTGSFAYADFQKNNGILSDLSDLFNVQCSQLYRKSIELLELNKKLKRELKASKYKEFDFDNLLKMGKDINGYKIFYTELSEFDDNFIRSLIDRLKAKYKNSFSLFIKNEGGGANKRSRIFLGISHQIADKFNASLIIKEIAKLVKGSGGGRSDFAQAGGDKIENSKVFFSKYEKIIRTIIKQKK
jgi:alanyl-tRNA synthetase